MPLPPTTPADDNGAGLGRQDELADLLAALSRSMEQLPGPTLGANGVELPPGGAEPAGADPGGAEPGRLGSGGRSDGRGPADERGSGGRSPPGWSNPADERGSTTGRRSRHSAPVGSAPVDDDGPGAGSQPVTRPTFDAFSTAPLHSPEPTSSPDLASGRTAAEFLGAEPLTPESPGSGWPSSDAWDGVVVHAPSGAVGVEWARRSVHPGSRRRRTRSPGRPAYDSPSVPHSSIDVPAGPVGESSPPVDERTSTARGGEAGRPPSSSVEDGRAEEPRAPRTSAPSASHPAGSDRWGA